MVFFIAVADYGLIKTNEDCRLRLHAEFMKHKDMKDVKQIDLLVFRHQIELKEIRCMQKNRAQVMKLMSGNSSGLPQTEFLDKFLNYN